MRRSPRSSTTLEVRRPVEAGGASRRQASVLTELPIGEVLEAP
jgi:hypothetical protein